MGITHVAFEASSHGLSQYRTEGLPVAAAAFTNFSRDHLDYHETMEAYFEAKMRLFDEVVAAGRHRGDLDRRSQVGRGDRTLPGTRACGCSPSARRGETLKLVARETDRSSARS